MSILPGGKLLRTETGYAHWCPAYKDSHHIWVPNWTFNGNTEMPTFSPSVKVMGKQIERDAAGEWTGEWLRGPDGKALDDCCHYILTDGVINYCSDCVHTMAGQSVPLSEWPGHLADE